jgi:hypothetical protein
MLELCRHLRFLILFFFPFVFKPGMTTEQIQNLCIQAQQYGLTWEGIFNGESCLIPTGTPTAGTETTATCPGGAPATITTVAK